MSSKDVQVAAATPLDLLAKQLGEVKIDASHASSSAAAAAMAVQQTPPLMVPATPAPLSQLDFQTMIAQQMQAQQDAFLKILAQLQQQQQQQQQQAQTAEGAVKPPPPDDAAAATAVALSPDDTTKTANEASVDAETAVVDADAQHIATQLEIDFRVPRSVCDNCAELLCRCAHMKYPECIMSCTGCVPGLPCNRNVQDYETAESTAKANVARFGIKGAKDNLNECTSSGLEFPPSQEVYCTHPTAKVETVRVTVNSPPLPPDTVIDASGSDNAKVVPDVSLFEFFRANPKLTRGWRDGRSGKTAGFHTRLSPAETEAYFKSLPERNLHSFNTRRSVPRTSHMAQHLWETRDAHTVIREVSLLGYASLPGMWSVRLETAAPEAPDKAFREYFSLQAGPNQMQSTCDNENLSITRANVISKNGAVVCGSSDSSSSNDTTDVSTQVVDVVDVVVSQAMNYTDLKRHAHITNANKLATESAFETLLNQQESADIVHLDEWGFRPWSNIQEEAFRAVQTNMLGDDAPASAPKPTQQRRGDQPMMIKEKYNMVDGAARDMNRTAFFNDNDSMINYVRAAHIMHFNRPLAAPLTTFYSFSSNCSILNGTQWMGVDYNAIMRSLHEQRKRTAGVFALSGGSGNNTMNHSSIIEIANTQRTIAVPNSPFPVVCAASVHAKFIADVMLPFVRRSTDAHFDVRRRDAIRDGKTVPTDSPTVLRRIFNVRLTETSDFIEVALATGRELNKYASGQKGGNLKFKQVLSCIIATTHAYRSAMVLHVKNDAEATKRRSTLNGNTKKLTDAIHRARDLPEVQQILQKQLTELYDLRLHYANKLFELGCPYAWLTSTPNETRLDMYIDYSAVMCFCLGMVKGIKWWTFCADLRPGLRVCFEWADSGISLTDKMLALEAEVNAGVVVLKRLAGESAESIATSSSRLNVAHALRDVSHPDYAYVKLAIKQLSPESMAWFEPRRVSTTWQVLHTPIWKHLILTNTKPVQPLPLPVAEGAVADDNERAEGGGAAVSSDATANDDDVRLLTSFAEQLVQHVRAKNQATWDEYSLTGKTRLIRTYMQENSVNDRGDSLAVAASSQPIRK